MSYNDDWQDSTLEVRRAMVRKTIRAATVGQLKDLSSKLFPA
jgi:hypothetical protein